MKKYFGWIRIICYLALFILFAFIQSNQLNQISICLLNSHFGILCPTCGITMAFYYIMHGDFVQAYLLHPLFVIAIFPIFTFLFIQDSFCIIKRSISNQNKQSIIEYIFRGFHHE